MFEADSTNYHSAPLAEKVRPVEFDQLLGQEHIWSPEAPLWVMARKDQINALIFWGPPGVGKTSLARIIAQASKRPCRYLSAVSTGVKELRGTIEESRTQARPSLLFLDEVHRLNKAQQDVLLPALEQGTIKFIGATTENPSFEVNKAVLSRCLCFGFKPVKAGPMKQIIGRALESYESQGIRLHLEVLNVLASKAEGDVRATLNLVECLCTSVEPGTEINWQLAQDLLPDVLKKYDKSGDQHYDTISAFIKSLRASHPDAALHYLARMIEGGEDVNFIARRMVIFASEDVGNASPTALLIANTAMQAVAMIGMPEARILLSQAACYLACSPKSNASYRAIDAALSDVRRGGGHLEIPFHLRNAPTEFMKDMGYGKGYAYPHEQAAEARKRSYLPEALAKRRYYQPKDVGTEKQIRCFLEMNRPECD